MVEKSFRIVANYIARYLEIQVSLLIGFGLNKKR